jgi:hypothetical protein
MNKNLKMMITILLMFVLITGCTKKAKEDELSILKENLNKVAEKVFITDKWTKGGIKEDTYTLTLKELSEHNQLKLEDYKNPKTGNLCDSEKSNIKFIVGKETEPNKTNYELKINLVCN